MHIIKPKEILFNQRHKNLDWSSFTDLVVGGFSSGVLKQHEDHLEFSGNVHPVFENAWAGMRSKKEAHNLSDYKFIEIKAQMLYSHHVLLRHQTLKCLQWVGSEDLGTGKYACSKVYGEQF